MIEIDGSLGEGGGQILRTSLSLSMATGQPLTIRNIRANRDRPGLMRQHLTSVRAAQEVSNATVEAAAIGSTELTFRPGTPRAGQYTFSVGTAGSTTLVIQTVLPALLMAGGRSDLVIEGGTHNPFAPPFDFLENAFVPVLRRMGADVSVTLNRPGYYPAGGGSLSVSVAGTERLGAISINDRGAIKRRQARTLVSNIPYDVALRESEVLKKRLNWTDDEVQAREIKGAQGPGNVVLIEIESENITEVFVGFGERGVRAEAVASRAADQARRYLAAGVPIGRYLADQLLVPMALGSGGEFVTLPLTKHTITNVAVIKQFLSVSIEIDEIDDCKTRVAIQP